MSFEASDHWPFCKEFVQRDTSDKSGHSVICTTAACEDIPFHFPLLIRLICSFGSEAPFASAITALSSGSRWAIITSSFVELVSLLSSSCTFPPLFNCSFPSSGSLLVPFLHKSYCSSQTFEKRSITCFVKFPWSQTELFVNGSTTEKTMLLSVFFAERYGDNIQRYNFLCFKSVNYILISRSNIKLQ